MNSKLKQLMFSCAVVGCSGFYVLEQRHGAAPQPATVSEATLAPPEAAAVRASATLTAPQPAFLQMVSAPASAQARYHDGAYKGPSINAYYGRVQVSAVIRNGRLVSVDVLDYPSDRRTSQRLSGGALPVLEQEVIQAQTARVDIVSGATLTSRAYMQSLDAALTEALGGHA